MSTAKNELVFKFKRSQSGELLVRKQYVLHSACCRNSDKDVAVMRLKISEDEGCLERKNNESQRHFRIGVSALLAAVERDHDKCVAMLVSSGADVTATYENLYHETDIDIVNVCIQLENMKTLNYFLKSGIYRSVSDTCANYYLFYAIKRCNYHDLNQLDVFFRNDIPIDDVHNSVVQLKDYPFSSPSVQILFSMNERSLRHFLLHGAVMDHRQTGRADLSPEAKDCFSIVHHFAVFAKFTAQIPMLETLYEFGADLWEKNRHGLTPLQVMRSPAWLERELSAREGDFDFPSYYYRHYIDPEQHKIAERMEELMRMPLSLRRLCRVTVLRCMGRRYLSNINKLGTLPTQVKLFLCGEES